MHANSHQGLSQWHNLILQKFNSNTINKYKYKYEYGPIKWLGPHMCGAVRTQWITPLSLIYSRRAWFASKNMIILKQGKYGSDASPAYVGHDSIVELQ